MDTPATGWTAERIYLLKRYATEGHSASKIARMLGGGITRSAVCGKINRLGLSLGTSLSPQQIKDRIAARQAAQQRWNARRDHPKAEKPAKPAARAMAEPERFTRADGSQVTLLDVKSAECRWPLWQDDPGDMPLCGHATFGGTPYCEHHAHKKRSAAFTPGPMPTALPEGPALRVTGTGHWH